MLDADNNRDKILLCEQIQKIEKGTKERTGILYLTKSRKISFNKQIQTIQEHCRISLRNICNAINKIQTIY